MVSQLTLPLVLLSKISKWIKSSLAEDEIHIRSKGSTAYEMGHDNRKYPLQRIIALAELASSLRLDALPQLKQAMDDKDSAVRYWAMLGILMRGTPAVTSARSELRRALADEAPSVRIVAAEALGKYGDANDLNKALPVLTELVSLNKNSVFVSMLALNAIDELGEKAAPALPAIKILSETNQPANSRTSSYVPRLTKRIIANLEKPTRKWVN